jgi:hypothetical protein
MARILLRVLGGFFVLVLLLVAADVLLWKHAVSAGNGLDNVVVTRVTVATLKGSKEEYYFDGTSTVQCSRSTLPMPAAAGWYEPCWWQRTHRQVVTRY